MGEGMTWCVVLHVRASLVDLALARVVQTLCQKARPVCTPQPAGVLCVEDTVFLKTRTFYVNV